MKNQRYNLYLKIIKDKMDDKKINSNKCELKSYNAYINKCRYFSKRKENNKSEYITKNKEMKINKANDKKSIKFSKVKFKYSEYKKNMFLENVKKFFLIYAINFILFNINGILCESYIIVKINKSGNYNILFNEGVEDENNYCNGIIMHNPTSVIINEIPIVSFTGKYEFTRDENTIKLFYEESKNNFKCLFYGCSDIDEIDVSHLITSNTNDLSNMFYLCNSLTSLIISNIDTSSVLYFINMFYSCKSLTSLDLSNFITEKAVAMYGMFNGCSNLKYLDIHNFDTSSVMIWDGCLLIALL